MDVFRLLLCVGFGVLLWRLRIRGREPIREFFLWGVDYPFHFLLTATLVLVVWGVVGAGFGLGGLFLDEDPLTQVLLGATVMLLLATITVHYVTLGTSRRGWWTAIGSLTRFLRRVNAVADRARPTQTALANGFLDRLTNSQIRSLDRAARAHRAGARGQPGAAARLRADDQLESEAFRLLVAPAILLTKGFGLIFLVGVVPAFVIPVLGRDPRGCLERLPWLVGVCLGHVLAVILGCWTTSWAAAAAGWHDRTRRILEAIDAWSPASRPQPEPAEPRPAAAWLAFLTAFFVVHACVNLLPPDQATSRWIDWPEAASTTDARGAFPWLPLMVLVGEACAAGLLVALMRMWPRLAGKERFERFAARGRSLAAAALGLGLRTLRAPWLHRLAWLAAIGLAVASVAVTLGMAPDATRSAWLGLRGYASLGAMLLCWLGIFWLATHAAVGHGTRSRREQQLALVAVCGLAGLHVLAAPAAVVAPLAAVAAVVSGSRTLAALWSGRPYGPLRGWLAAGLAVAAAASLAAGWEADRFAVVAAVWLGLAILFLGSTMLAGAATSQPAILYPLTVLLGYFAFAIPYTALGERWQSAMPAAGSIAVAFALLAAVYTLVVLARPRSPLLTALALLATAVLVNGAALFMAPNEFKGSFPNMAAYYRLPVYLDSRDYFRDTTPSTARLRNRRVTEDFDRMQRQRPSERLATVYFSVAPAGDRPDGSPAVTLRVEDPRSRLRAVVGDTLRLSAEEWFTMRVDGDDLVALAEEPFYRRIFRWFRYETLHMIRDGIIRGPTRPLVAADGPQPVRRPGQPRMTPYRFITGTGGEHDLLGLRLLDLAADYRALEAEYAIISMSWNGVVKDVRHERQSDVYTVEFSIPEGGAGLDADQLRTMASWMERCHLDTLRPAVPALAAPDHPPPTPDGNEPGRCLVLEDVRTEAAVPVGVFLAEPPESPPAEPAFAAYLPRRETIAATIAATPPPTAADGGPDAAERFTLRPAHDRGLFSAPDGASLAAATAGRPRPISLAFYNAGRLRPGDRLILAWNGPGDGAAVPRHGGVFEVVSIGGPAEAPATAGPPGAVLVTLEAVEAAGAEAFRGQPVQPDAGPIVGQWQTLQLLNNTEVLLAWKRLVGDRWRGRKPKLVLVTVSGGGIRASVWTAVVLRKLEATLGSDFPYHIRLITGASGGMVAGSYYATSLVPPPAEVLRGGRVGFERLHGTTVQDFVDRMATDQLDAVAGRMLFADLPGTLSPFVKRGDRGRTLEQTWIRWTGGAESPLGRSLQSFAADERLGWRPSLAFTPMMVEDGRRILISNLDLAFATRNVGGLLLEPSSRKIERPAIQGGDFDLSIHEEDDVFSLSAVEFFRLFPAAHDFQVTTAIRMSASFPWVSPAINLPTLPPRRVVDAAYYDNYGVNLSALWLSKMSAWLEENTSGVLVVQIRDNVSQGARTEIDFDRVGAEDAPLDRLVWHGGSRLARPGLQAISTPLIGVTNARDWTMAFRNDEQVDLQDLLFDDKRGSDFFRTVVFECPVEVSLSWKLTEREKAVLAGGFGRPEATPREELARVKDYMTGRDSYEFHKWRIDHRNDPDFQRALKDRYDEQLRALGIPGIERLSTRESQALYENVVKNLKRLELLADWWTAGRADD